LVLDVVTILDECFVTLAPGIARKKSHDTGYDIEVAQKDACRAAGLTSPTCFTAVAA
jgi:hypothetical protein